MKLNTFRITALSLLLGALLLGTSAFLYAQDAQDHPAETQPPQEKPQPEAAKPPQDEGKPPRHEDVKPPEHPQDVKQQRPPKHEESKQKEQAEQSHPAQRSANRKHGHIPDDKFRANFGRQHKVVINHPTIVEGQPRFQYGGYTFVIVDVWPVDWAYTDECYIDYVDGEYFLFDLLHPGVRVAIVVVL